METTAVAALQAARILNGQIEADYVEAPEPVAEKEHLWDFPGFAPLTRIETAYGEFPVQTLRVGDRVRTRMGPLAQIRWLDRVVLNEEYLHRHPEAQPILVQANALGHGFPRNAILLSPGQKIFAAGGLGSRRVVTAGELLKRGKAVRKPETVLTYTFFTCASPVDVRIEGVFAPLEPPHW